MAKEVTYQCAARDCTKDHTALLYEGDLIDVDRPLTVQEVVDLGENPDVYLVADGGFSTPVEGGYVAAENRQEQTDLVFIGTADQLLLLRFVAEVGWEIVWEQSGDFTDILGPGTDFSGIVTALKHMSKNANYDWRRFYPVAAGGFICATPEEIINTRMTGDIDVTNMFP